uniref:Catechol-O-methyltransferase domain containing 1 n=1 Tax=Coturnix japonica TaxID=93934 RepID=A0A8C2U3N5_COTJA
HTVIVLYFHSCLSTGHIFRLFVHLIRARKILLIGKLKGYSILAIAEELPDDGKIFACAEAPYLGVNSQEAFDYSSDGKKISMRVGPIADMLKALHAEDEHFDIVFIDADQRNAVNYYSFVMDNHLLRMDGVICVENTLMKGQVYLENISEENVLAVRKLNTVINSDPRVEQVGAMQLVRLPAVLYLWIFQCTHQNLSFVGAIIQRT